MCCCSVFSIKLGVIEDHSNRTRLAKLLRFFSSNSSDKVTSLADYIGRMKDKQDTIYFMAGTSRKEVENSPFVERLLKKGYEVLYLTEPIDEYCIQVCNYIIVILVSLTYVSKRSFAVNKLCTYLFLIFNRIVHLELIFSILCAIRLQAWEKYHIYGCASKY